MSSKSVVLEYLASRGAEWTSLFDVPCGSGDFLEEVGRRHPGRKLLGADIAAPERRGFDFIRFDASKDFPIPPAARFDVITSISGVMEFDNTSGFIRNCLERLNEGGALVVTNDNCFTVRDRLSYLLIGRLRRFPLLLEAGTPTYRHVPLQELCKIFYEQGLRLEKVRYVGFFPEDFLFLPLALLLYPLQLVHLLTRRSNVPRPERIRLFPFRSLLARHYVLFLSRVLDRGLKK